MYQFSLNRTFLTLIFLLLLSSCGGGGDDTSLPPVPTPLTIQDSLNNAVTQGVDGIFVSVDVAHLSSTYSSGIQDRVSSAAADPASLFKIASLSKLFIAVSAAKLSYQNLISLDDTLAFWLPELANRIQNSSSITLRYMIQHRSGIADFDTQPGFSWQDSHSDIDQTLEFALDAAADFAPNARYAYSNTNYLLIAKILDRALAYNHETYIRDEIFTPLGMVNTYSQLAEVNSDLMVKGYWDNVDTTNRQYVIPGGSMISTVEDIAIFMRALNTGNLLNAGERAIYADLYTFGHSGWVPGYQSIASYHSNIDAVIIQFVNTTGGLSENIATNTHDVILALLNN